MSCFQKNFLVFALPLILIICGVRYKCQTCGNFDLCENCYDDGKHSKSHVFLQIERFAAKAVEIKPQNQVPEPPSNGA